MTNDLQKELYSPAYINLLSSLPRVLLEDFATQTATAGTSDKIAQLFDQYLNFIVSEPDLFSLGMQKDHTYWALNSASTNDADLDRMVDRIVSGLFSVIVTMGEHRILLHLLAFTDLQRCHSRYSMPERCGRKTCRRAARSEAARSYPQFKRQPLLFSKNWLLGDTLISPCPHPSGSQC